MAWHNTCDNFAISDIIFDTKIYFKIPCWSLNYTITALSLNLLVLQTRDIYSSRLFEKDHNNLNFKLLWICNLSLLYSKDLQCQILFVSSHFIVKHRELLPLVCQL